MFMTLDAEQLILLGVITYDNLQDTFNYFDVVEFRLWGTLKPFKKCSKTAVDD